jgi:maltooligosyltrehalose trehalohydrolase
MTETAPLQSGAETLWRLEYGARPLPGEDTRFRVWAPNATSVALRIEGGRDRPMLEVFPGEYELRTHAAPGTDYFYVLDGARALPDPVSRWQPKGVHGPSRVYDPDAFPWSDGAWRGMPLMDLVTAEVHIGTFTPGGTFGAAIEKLEYLRDVGINAVEVMPVAAFPGERNWGYDGVHWYATQHSYGGPEAFKAFVNAAHRLGMAVILDVVYNHIGPQGNYLPAFSPFFSARYRTPWGDAINYDDADCDAVRRHAIENALFWLTEYHVDGLRLDAIHHIYDNEAWHVLSEMRERFHAQAAALGKPAYLIGESDLNDTRVFESPARGGWGLDSQWSDDFHHSLRALLTDNRRGYFADFGRVADLAKAIESGFAIDGRYSQYRRRRHGRSAAGRPGRHFTVCTQNHDQIANGTLGHRLSTVIGTVADKLAAAMLLCAPNPPLLFMGQEYGEVAPFHYFTSHGDPGLAEAVTKGRYEEIAAFLDGETFSDPQAESTYTACKLDWSLMERDPHAGMLRWYRALLRVRREWTCLRDDAPAARRVHFDEARRWMVVERGAGTERAWLFANVSAAAQRIPAPTGSAAGTLALWSEDKAFGERGAEAPPESLTAGVAVNLGGWACALYFRSEA